MRTAREAGIDEPGQFDHRILRGIDRGLAALEELLADLGIADLGAADEFVSALPRRLAGEHLLHQVVFRPERGGEERQPVGELDCLQVLVDRLVGEELELEARQPGVGELAEPFAGGLGQFLRGAQQGAGDPERCRVEARAVLQHGDFLDDLGPHLLGLGDLFERLLGLRQPRRRRRACRHGLRLDELLEPLLVGDLAAHELRVQQPGQPADARLAAVLDAEQFVLGPLRVPLAAAAPGARAAPPGG